MDLGSCNFGLWILHFKFWILILDCGSWVWDSESWILWIVVLKKGARFGAQFSKAILKKGARFGALLLGVSFLTKGPRGLYSLSMSFRMVFMLNLFVSKPFQISVVPTCPNIGGVYTSLLDHCWFQW